MNGIDVSHFQGSVQWVTVKNDTEKNIEFAFLKATQGTTYVDPLLRTNAVNAGIAEMPISYYHFATINTQNVVPDAIAEADFFINTIKDLPKNSFPLALDIEANKAGVNKSGVLTWVNTFMQRLAELGYNDTFLYSYSPFLNSNLPTNHGLGKYKLWIAAYTNKLKLPAGWEKETIWQYSAKGSVNGIHTDVDLNKTDSPLF